MAACTNHPERESLEACAGCSKPFCADCLVRFEKLALCEGCKARYLEDVEAAAPVAVAGAAPAGGPPNAAPRRRAPRAPSASTPLEWIGGAVALAFAALFTFVIVASLAKPFRAWAKDHRREQAVDVLATVGAALERYHADTGKWPDKLAQLVPRYLTRVPDDPFASPAAPPHYGKDGDGVLTLWSVGENGRDDGAASPEDVVYTVEPAP